MSARDGGALPQQDPIEQNILRTVGRRALSEIRGIVDEELRLDEARERFLRSFLKYGLAAMLLLSFALAYLLGVF